MRKKSAQPDFLPEKKPGCLRRLLTGVITLVLIGITVALIVSMMGGDDKTHRLHGEVLIMNDANFEVAGETCRGVNAFAGIESGATMTVTVRDKDPVETALENGVLSSEGNCWLSFVADVPDGDWAMFAVADQAQEQRLNKQNADTAVEGAAAEDWWVSVQYDQNE